MTAVLERDYVLPDTIEAVKIGPTWQRDEAGKFILPDLTIGWQVIDWCGENLLGPKGKPWKFTNEQARFVLWLYAVDKRGVFLYREATLQRLKGWGKDPLAAVICSVEAIGPCRVDLDRWSYGITIADPLGRPHPPAMENDVAWIQVAAVTKFQTQNTMRLFPSLYTTKAKTKWRIDVASTKITFLGGTRIIQAVTSNPAALQGGRATFVILNEIHEWIETNKGHAMLAVIADNATKSPDGAARTLAITNAFNPNQNSVGQVVREAYEAEEGGDAIGTGVLYDSLEAPEEAMLAPPPKLDMADEEQAAEFKRYVAAVIEAVRGDSTWLNVERIVNSIFDRKNPPSRSRRMWYNQIIAAEDAWLDRQAVRAARHRYAMELRASDSDALRASWKLVEPTEPMVIFFDGSKSDDETALVGCRLSDGLLITLGAWYCPSKREAPTWRAPRDQVDTRVREIVGDIDDYGTFKRGRFNVVAFWGDPGHIRNDEDDSRYWDPLFDTWHIRYKDILQVWAVKTGHNQHSIRWDMTNEERVRQFTEAAETFVEQIEHKDDEGLPAPQFQHDGHPRLEKHLMNAKKYGNKHGTSLWKGHRESAAKVDLAVCAVGARLLRRLTLNTGLEKPKNGRRGGWTDLG